MAKKPLTQPRKDKRLLRKEAIADLYLRIPGDKRRRVEAAFADLLVDTLESARAQRRAGKVSERRCAEVLRGCASAYKQFGEIVNEGLEAEERVRKLMIPDDSGVPSSLYIPPSIMEFIPKMSPQYESPTHLRKYVEALESTLHSEQRVVISCPPQHGKTETTMHALVWYMLSHPGSRNAYISYQSERSENVSTRIQWIADEARLAHTGTRKYWRCNNGSDLIATGIGGGITGYGFDGLVVVDDPFKGMAEANSPTIRNHVKEWFQSVLMTRVHAGASVVVIQTRWHPEDLAGQLISEGWKEINLQALIERVDNEGKQVTKPLWPEKWPLDLLSRRRAEVGEYVWSALYMGQPRPRGGQIFNKPRFYQVIPEGDRRYWIGVDLAYTKKSYADYSVAVVLAEVAGKFYVADVVRVQEEPPQFRDRVNQLKYQYPNAVLAVGVAQSEQGSAYFMGEIGLELCVQKATADKFLRAQPVAAAVNAGEVLLPEDAFWLADFKREMTNFTGVGDTHDDQIDALGSAYNAARYGSVSWSEIERLQREAPKAQEFGLSLGSAMSL